MKQLVFAIYIIGAVMLLTGASVYITGWSYAPYLFTIGSRVDKSRSKKTGGTGLGLAIVKHICIRYNASLDIESVFGEGTCVTVGFPAPDGV